MEFNTVAEADVLMFRLIATIATNVEMNECLYEKHYKCNRRDEDEGQVEHSGAYYILGGLK